MWSRFEQDHIITCSDDQSVKIWNLINIKSKKPPNKKKKDAALGEVIIERDDEGQDDEPEGNEYYNTDKFRDFTTKPKAKEGASNKNEQKEETQTKRIMETPKKWD